MDDQVVDVLLAGLYDKGERVLSDDDFEDGSDEDYNIDADVGGFDTRPTHVPYGIFRVIQLTVIMFDLLS